MAYYYKKNRELYNKKERKSEENVSKVYS